jgi:hypothetical protein
MKSRCPEVAVVSALAWPVLSAATLAAATYYPADEALLDQVLDEMEIEYKSALDDSNDPV